MWNSYNKYLNSNDDVRYEDGILKILKRLQFLANSESLENDEIKDVACVFKD